MNVFNCIETVGGHSVLLHGTPRFQVHASILEYQMMISKEKLSLKKTLCWRGNKTFSFIEKICGLG